MTPERSNASDAHEDERTRDRREKRIRAEATADAHALAERRMQCLRVEPDPVEIDFPGCYS